MDFYGLNLVSNEYETIWVHRNRDLVKSDFSVNSKYLLLGRNLKIWSSKSRKIIKFCPLKNFRPKVFSPWIWWFFDFLGSIYSGIDRVRNILSSQKNQVLRDLFSHQLKISHTRSKPNLRGIIEKTDRPAKKLRNIPSRPKFCADYESELRFFGWC